MEVWGLKSFEQFWFSMVVKVSFVLYAFYLDGCCVPSMKNQPEENTIYHYLPICLMNASPYITHQQIPMFIHMRFHHASPVLKLLSHCNIFSLYLSQAITQNQLYGAFDEVLAMLKMMCFRCFLLIVLLLLEFYCVIFWCIFNII